MHNVRLGLIWAAAILVFALLASSFGMSKQISFVFVTGISVLAVLHIGRSERQRKGCS